MEKGPGAAFGRPAVPPVDLRQPMLASIAITPQRNFPPRRSGVFGTLEAQPCSFGGKAATIDTQQGNFAQKGKRLQSRTSCKYGATAKLDA
jgi:hypothetical protein